MKLKLNKSEAKAIKKEIKWARKYYNAEIDNDLSIKIEISEFLESKLVYLHVRKWTKGVLSSKMFKIGPRGGCQNLYSEVI